MSHSRWNVKDKAWMADRKSQWGAIKERLEITESYTKKELKTYENYFLKGKEPKWDKEWGDDPIPLLYRLWFDPDQSVEHWQAIIDAVLAYPGPTQIGPSLEETYGKLWQAGNYVSFSGIDTSDGFMGGLEEKIFHFLMGSPDSGDYLEYGNGQKIFKGLRFSKGHYNRMRRWLNLKYLQNSYLVDLYALEYWYHRLTDDLCESIKNDEKKGSSGEQCVLDYLQVVANYPEPVEGDANFIRQDYCEKVRKILNERPLPALMKQWWEQANA